MQSATASFPDFLSAYMPPTQNKVMLRMKVNQQPLKYMNCIRFAVSNPKRKRFITTAYITYKSIFAGTSKCRTPCFIVLIEADKNNIIHILALIKHAVFNTVIDNVFTYSTPRKIYDYFVIVIGSFGQFKYFRFCFRQRFIYVRYAESFAEYSIDSFIQSQTFNLNQIIKSIPPADSPRPPHPHSV